MARLKVILLTLLTFFSWNVIPAGAEEMEDSAVERGPLEKLAGGFSFTEGPAADGAGNVYFTDQPNDRIMVWSSEDILSTWMQPSGRSNGLMFDKNGNLVACADEKNQLWEISPDRKIRALISDFEGRLLNGPNDVWVGNDNSLYFTDPYYQRSYWDRNGMEQPGKYVYRVSPDRAEVQIVEDRLTQPNGITGSPDGETLYIADIGDGKTYSYRISENGLLAERRLFCEMGSDGMTVDLRGNLYLTGDGVTIFSPEGRKIDHIDVPERWTANVCFGGADMKSLFITASKSLYRVRIR